MVESTGKRYYGTVLWFGDHLGYGFIDPDDSAQNDIFFHFSYLHMKGWKTIAKGTRVSFEIGRNHKDAMAVKIDFEGPAPSSSTPASRNTAKSYQDTVKEDPVLFDPMASKAAQDLTSEILTGEKHEAQKSETVGLQQDK